MLIESVMWFYRVENRMKELYSNFRGYLYLNLPRIKWVLVFGMLFFVVFCILQIKAYRIQCYKMVRTMLCGYVLTLNCAFIFVMTLFGRAMGENYRFALRPFRSYYLAFVENDIEILLQILVNIAMYIPIGFLLPCCFKMFEKCRHVVFVVLIMSLCIELIQGVFRLGLFETDDIMNNMLGMTVGIGIYKLCKFTKERVRHKQK